MSARRTLPKWRDILSIVGGLAFCLAGALLLYFIAPHHH
jgi:hypothetical protein